MDPELMPRRLQLQEMLEVLLGSDQVHFQPPANIDMKYPAIVYGLDDLMIQHADNSVYNLTKRYSVIVITDDPDSDIPDKVAVLPMCSFDRSYPADNLYHYAYVLYF